MMGLERNSDVVKMASYAPLLFNVNDIAWPVSMIALDSSRVAGRSSYYVQKLFARNRPDEVLATRLQSSRGTAPRDLYVLAGLDKKAGQIVLKVVNRAACGHAVTVRLRGLAAPGPTAEVTTLSHADPTAENTLDDPQVVVPATSRFDGIGPEFSYTFQPYSLTILRIALQR